MQHGPDYNAFDTDRAYLNEHGYGIERILFRIQSSK